jgi:RNA-splicing ligase RtcB
VDFSVTTSLVCSGQWGESLEHEAVMQMEKACLLLVSVAGALMPDAHVGYGLLIGGVLAAENAVIPYAVGVDIACRMKMTVLGERRYCSTWRITTISPGRRST